MKWCARRWRDLQWVSIQYQRKELVMTQKIGIKQRFERWFTVTIACNQCGMMMEAKWQFLAHFRGSYYPTPIVCSKCNARHRVSPWWAMVIGLGTIIWTFFFMLVPFMFLDKVFHTKLFSYLMIVFSFINFGFGLFLWDMVLSTIFLKYKKHPFVNHHSEWSLHWDEKDKNM